MVMFSSDYPHWDFDHPKLALAPFPKNMRNKIRSENAAALYGLHSKINMTDKGKS